MSFWKTLAKFAPLAAFAIPGVGPAVGGALAGIGRSGVGKGVGKFFNSPGGAQLTNLAGLLVGSGLESRGANRAADLTARANTDTLAWLKEQDARDRAEYEKEREREWRLTDEDRARKYGYEDIDRGRTEEDRQLKLLREREREGRLAPFRQGAERGYQTLSSLLFNPSQAMGRSVPVGTTGRASLADLMRSA